MSANSPEPPKAFISYSWTSPTHETWVLNLAIRLREDGVDVVLDKWDLKPGHDAYQFMEKMVSDPSLKKVLMVCDKAYSEKANARSGGVGTESQIISPELYSNTIQDKYAALTTELDEEGRAYVPVFYKGRIYFDFTRPENFEAAYEELLRWLVDKPLHVKPALGKTPAHLNDPSRIAPATVSRARRAEDAIREGAQNAVGFVQEYIDALYEELSKHGPDKTDGVFWDEAVVDAIARMQPYVRQFHEVARATIRFSPEPRLFEQLLQGIERLGNLMFKRAGANAWSDSDFDAFRFVVDELFLALVALTIREERFELTSAALNRTYLIPEARNGADRATASFTVFRQYTESLTARKSRLQLQTTNLQASMLAEFHQSTIPSFEDLMQADFVLYLRAFNENPAFYERWWPITLAHADRRRQPFTIFARSESSSFFQRLAPLLGLKSVAQFNEMLVQLAQEPLRFGIFPVQVSSLANAQNLGVVP